MNRAIYDSNGYYDSDGKASRLASGLNPLLNFLDRMKAQSFIKKLSIPKGNVLDVGAGDGKFLYYMKQAGMIPFGTSASQISCDAAKKNYGIDLDYSTELSGKLLKQKYEAISYWHVFEHLEDPEAHVKQWPLMLADGGKVMIEVPNIDSIGASLSFDAWLGSDLKHHINHMSRKQIQELVQRYNLKVDAVEYFSLKFSYVFLWSALLGFIFGKSYNFDTVFALIKEPFTCLKRKPLFTINGLAAVFYLLPVILLLIPVGLVSKRGEVLKMYISPNDK